MGVTPPSYPPARGRSNALSCRRAVSVPMRERRRSSVVKDAYFFVVVVVALVVVPPALVVVLPARVVVLPAFLCALVVVVDFLPLLSLPPHEAAISGSSKN